MVNKMLYSFGFLGVFILIFAGAVFADSPPPPFVAELESLPAYTAGTSVHLVVDATITPTDGVMFRFKREAISGRPELNEVTDWLPTIDYTFDGMLDAETYAYYVQGTDSVGDTTTWSSPQVTMQDVYDPNPVECVEASALPGNQIQVQWRRAYDSASGVGYYRIYRSRIESELNIIDDRDYLVATVTDDGRERFFFTDDGPEDHIIDLDSNTCYYYAVVPVDRVEHFPNTGNIVLRECTRHYPCFPPCANLLPVDSITTTPFVTVRVNVDECPSCGYYTRLYRFRRFLVYDDSTITYLDSTGWSDVPEYTFYGADCERYGYEAQAQDVGWMTSSWSAPIFTKFDLEGPKAIDSIYAEPLDDGRIEIEFWADNPDSMDCGAGLMRYRLYRVTPDELGALETIGPEDDIYLVRYFYPTIGDGTYFRYIDADLIDGECYIYTVVPEDRLGRLSPYPRDYAEACVDNSCPAFILDALPLWTSGDSITLTIIDTSLGDADSIIIEYDVFPDFHTAVSGIWRSVHDPIFSNPEDFDDEDIDTLTFTIGGLMETRYYFRVQGVDALGNISEWSNVVHTRLDNSSPNAVHIDTIYSRADSVETVSLTVGWEPSFDYGIGVSRYIVYRSDTPGALGEEVAGFPASSCPFVWTDYSPNPGNYFHDNYYTVAAVDSFGYENSSGMQISLRDGTPPAVPVIDTVYISPLRENVIIELQDTTPFAYGSPFGNRYSLYYAQEESWIWLGDPLLFYQEEPVAATRMVLPIEIFSGSPDMYFSLVAVDLSGNESGFSHPYYYELEEFEVDSVRIDLAEGWNMVSIPLYPRDRDFNILFPGARDCVSWDPIDRCFVSEDVLETGKGYFVSSLEDRTYWIKGMPSHSITRHLYRGWNLVGSIFEESGYSTDPDGLLISPYLYWYNPDTRIYDTHTSARSGYGYWALAREEGDIVFPAEDKQFETFSPEWLAGISLDTEQGGIRLEFGMAENGDRFDLPMPPPVPGMQCVSFEGGLLRDIAEIGDEATFKIALPHKMRASWSLPDVDGQFILEDADGNRYDMRNITSASLSGEITIYYKRAIPYRMAILGNVPNPFNLETRLGFVLPEEKRVLISIYTIDGKLVRNLVSDVFPSGESWVVWDGCDDAGSPVGSGVYLYRVIADDFRETKKMVLIK